MSSNFSLKLPIEITALHVSSIMIIFFFLIYNYSLCLGVRPFVYRILPLWGRCFAREVIRTIIRSTRHYESYGLDERQNNRCYYSKVCKIQINLIFGPFWGGYIYIHTHTNKLQWDQIWILPVKIRYSSILTRLL